MSRAASVQARRLGCAAAVVAFLVAIAPLSDAVLRQVGVVTDPGAAYDRLDARSLILGGGAHGVLERIEQAADADETRLTEAFSDEVGLPSEAQGARATGGGSVVSYAVQGDDAAALEALRGHLEQRGWSYVSLGSIEGGTFIKNAGEYRWILATCTQVGSTAVVVLRLK